MELSGIEEKADELLAAVLSEEHASRAEHAARKLRCLELTARIKSTVAFRKEREDERAAQPPSLPYVPLAFPVPPTAGPTKPAVDRLHELVSYGVQMEAENRTVEYPCPDAADAYQDMASKLQEILSEGGL